MEVYGIKPIDSSIAYGVSQVGQTTDQLPKQSGNSQDHGLVSENKAEHQDLNRKDAKEVTDEMNSIVQALNTDIQFKLHEKTKQLMVQVVDIKDGTVLKEFPPHELLDVMAKIREYVGSLIDKKV